MNETSGTGETFGMMNETSGTSETNTSGMSETCAGSKRRCVAPPWSPTLQSTHQPTDDKHFLVTHKRRLLFTLNFGFLTLYILLFTVHFGLTFSFFFANIFLFFFSFTFLLSTFEFSYIFSKNLLIVVVTLFYKKLFFVQNYILYFFHKCFSSTFSTFLLYFLDFFYLLIVVLTLLFQENSFCSKLHVVLFF